MGLSAQGLLLCTGSGWDMCTPCSLQQQGTGLQTLSHLLCLLHAHVFTLPTPSARAVTDEPLPNTRLGFCSHHAWTGTHTSLWESSVHPHGTLLLRPDLCTSHPAYFSSHTISWLGCKRRSCQEKIG